LAVGSKIGEAYIQLEARMGKYEAQLKSAEVMTGKSVGKMQSKFQALAPTFRKVGIGMGLAGGAITAAVVGTFKAFTDYETKLVDMAKVTGESFESIEEKITSIDPILGSSTQLMAGYYQVISAGVKDPVKALETLTIAAQTAKAAHVDQSEVVKGITKMMAGYEGAIKSTSEAADLLFSIEKEGQTSVAELIPVIGGLAKVSSDLNIDQIAMAASMATITKTAGSTAEASTQYEAILTGLMKPTENMTKAISKMGYETAEAAIKELGFVQVLKNLEEETGGSAQALGELFGRKEAMIGFSALGAKGFETLNDTIVEVGKGVGSQKRAFDEWSKSGQASIEEIKNTFVNFGVDVGRILAPKIKELMGKITDIIKKISDWAKAHSGITSAIVKFAVVLGPLLVGLGGLLMVLPGLVTLAPLVGAAFHTMLGPVGLVTAAIAGAVAAFLYFYKTNEKFAAFINKMGGAIKTFVTDAWDRLVWLIKNWGEVWEAAKQIVTETFKFIGKTIWKVLTNKDAFIAFIKLWSQLYISVGKIITDTMVFVGKVIARASSIIWAPIWESLKWLGEQFAYWFGKIENAILKAIGTAVKWVTEKFVKLANFITQKVLNPIIAGFESFANAILGSIGWVVEKIIRLFGKLPNFILKAFGTSKEEVKQFATDIKEKFEVELGRIPEIAEDALTFEIPQKTLQEPKKFADRMSDAWEIIKAQYRDIPGDLAIYLKQLETEWNEITAAAGEFGDAVGVEEYKAKIDGVIAKLKELGIDTTELEKTQKELQEQLDKTAGSVNKLTKNLDNLKDVAIATGKKLVKSFDDFEDVAIPATANVTDAIVVFLKKLDGVTEAIEKIPPALAKIKDIDALGDINEALEALYMSFKPFPPVIEKVSKALQEIKDVEALGDINEALELLYMSFKPLPRTIEKTRLNLEKIKDVDALGDINEALELLYLSFRPLPEAIKKIPIGIKKAEDVIVPAFVNISVALRDWIIMMTKPLPAAIKAIPIAVEKAKDVIVGATDEEIQAILDLIKEWKKARNEVKTFAEIAADTWASAYESIGRAAFSSIVDIIRGVKTMEEAFLEFAKKLQTIVVDALLNLAVAAAKSGNAIAAIFLGLGALIVATFDKIISELDGSAEAARDLENALSRIGATTEWLEESFKDIGISLTGSINNAERAIRNLQQAQEDLALNTREKLIKELDNYYDYRVLKEMDLTELLALSAETRLGLEAGTLEEIAETAEEVAEREKDAKVGTLAAIEDAYAKESALIDKKIKLIEIEITLLMAAAQAERGNLEAAEQLRRKALADLSQMLYTEEELLEMEEEKKKARKGEKKGIDDVADATKDATRETKKYGREGKRSADDVRNAFGRTRREIEDLEGSTDKARVGIEDWGDAGRMNAQKLTEGFNEARIGIELWGNEIDKLPKQIDIGWDIPDFPELKIPTQTIYTDWGIDTPDFPRLQNYQIGTPYVPRTQVAVVHKGEAIIPAGQNRAGGAGGNGGTQVVYERGAIRMIVQGGINQQVDLEKAMDYLAKKQTELMRRPGR